VIDPSAAKFSRACRARGEALARYVCPKIRRPPRRSPCAGLVFLTG